MAKENLPADESSKTPFERFTEAARILFNSKPKQVESKPAQRQQKKIRKGRSK